MKKHRPTTAGLRGTKTVTYRGVLTASKPKKSLTKGFKRAMGRNHQGRITAWYRGGGNKRLYRDIDFLYNKHDIPARVETIEYDPNRSAFISLMVYRDGERRYVVTPQSVKVGDSLIVSENAPQVPGNRMPLHKIPVGTFIYNVELKPMGGAKLARSAGTYIQVSAQDDTTTNLKMPSGEVRKVSNRCWASIGEVSNSEYKLRNLGKAGRSRWVGRRPKVRGSAKNPVDHPYGGGEGRQGRGTKRPKTRHGKITGGKKTRKPKKYSNPQIVSRRKTKRNK